VERAECQIRNYLQWVVSVVAKMSMKPVWSNTVPSIVIVPANSANLSVVVDLVVQFPDLVVERVTVVEIGPVGVSLADTVTVLVDVQVRLLQLASGICVGLMATDRSVPIVTVSLLSAHPNSSEIGVNRPLLENEYLEIWRHGGPSDPSSFENTERNISVQS
jgi:hypothetical protein